VLHTVIYIQNDVGVAFVGAPNSLTSQDITEQIAIAANNGSANLRAAYRRFKPEEWCSTVDCVEKRAYNADLGNQHEQDKWASRQMHLSFP